MSLVSVILASNKVDEYFYIAIKSIQEQSFEQIEIIIVLNGLAVFDEASVLRELSIYSNVKIYTTNVGGLNFSLNLGIHHASGKYIARMDADDISYVDRILTQFEFLEKTPDVAVCGSFYDAIDELGRIQTTKVLPTTDAEIRKFLTIGNPICHPSVMYRKEIVSQIGAYLNGQYAEDYDLWVRLASIPGVRFANIEKSLLGYRTAGENQARRSRLAYASVSATQWRQFVACGHPKWLIASILSIAKVTFLGR